MRIGLWQGTLRLKQSVWQGDTRQKRAFSLNIDEIHVEDKYFSQHSSE